MHIAKKVREKSRECHNHKPQPFPDPKKKRKPTNLNKYKPNKRTKSIKISSLFPKRGNRNTKRTEKHKNKMTHGKTYNKSPCIINYKATKSKTNTGTTALERSVEQTIVCVCVWGGGGGVKALLQLTNFTLGPDATLNTASLVKIPCYLLKLSSGNENMGVSRADNSADNSVKIWRNLLIRNPKPDRFNVNAYSKFC